MRRRVAFVSTMRGYRWGGSEELWSRAAGRLAQAGARVAVSTKAWEEEVPQVRTLREQGCAVFAYVDHARTWFEKVQWRLGRLPRAAWMDQARPDLVVISMGWFSEGFEWMEECRRRGIPYVLVVQAVGVSAFEDAAVLERLREGYEGAACCCFVSRANLESVRIQLGALLPRAEIVRNPFSVPFDSHLPWPDGEAPRLACVARVDFFSKGQDLLVELLAMEKWRRRPLTIDLYGAGPSAPALGRILAARGLQAIRIRGHVADIAAVWREHHALILPSRVEGTPLALVEAMLCARPAIVTDVGGNAEVLADNDTGFLAAAPTVKALDEALERAWARRAEWRAMGERAASAIRERIPRDPVGEFVRMLDGVAGAAPR